MKWFFNLLEHFNFVTLQFFMISAGRWLWTLYYKIVALSVAFFFGALQFYNVKLLGSFITKQDTNFSYL